MADALITVLGTLGGIILGAAFTMIALGVPELAAEVCP